MAGFSQRSLASFGIIVLAGIALSGCKQAAAPANATNSPPVSANATNATPAAANAAVQIGYCYESNNCTPAGNPMPGGTMSQAECALASTGGKSWQSVGPGGAKGPCIAPP
jgi:hypothetical protein